MKLTRLGIFSFFNTTFEVLHPKTAKMRIFQKYFEKRKIFPYIFLFINFEYNNNYPRFILYKYLCMLKINKIIKKIRKLKLKMQEYFFDFLKIK